MTDMVLFWICVIAALGVALALYMFLIETRWFRLGRATIYAGDSFPYRLRVLHLADAHFRRGNRAKMRFIQSLAQYPVDFVFVTGDMIDSPCGIEYCVKALEALKPRYGTYFALGGHDHYNCTFFDVLHHLTHFQTSKRVSRENDKAQLVARLREVGARVLENENVRVKLDSGEVVIVGLDDPFLALHDLKPAMRGISDADPTIMLVHAIENLQEIVETGVDLVFAGHTHGGQVRLPFIGALVTRCGLDRQNAAGVFKMKNTFFHVNKGLGAGKYTDFRFWCRPEATIVDIVPGITEEAPCRRVRVSCDGATDILPAPGVGHGS